MKKTALSFFITATLIFGGHSFAGPRKAEPYSPQPAQKYGILKKYFPELTADDIEKSAEISRRPEFIFLINNILIYLKHKKLIKRLENLPAIIFLYSEKNNTLAFTGGLYYDHDNIIILNANNFYTGNIKPNSLPKNMQAAADFVTFSAILGHEIMHYEDISGKSRIRDMKGAALSEFNAYKISEKIIDYFIKMPKAEAEEIIPIEGFYDSVRHFEEYFTDMRKNYIKIASAAKIFLKNEKQIRDALGLDEDKFKMLEFEPRIVFNAKDGGHIINVESGLLNLRQKLLFEINIISGDIKLLNKPSETEAFKKEAGKITFIDKNRYTVKTD